MTVVAKKCAGGCGDVIVGAPQKRFCGPCKSARHRTTIRHLRAGERPPDGPPRRYVAASGYIRLRWKVGIRAYVETYEHRLIDGRVTVAEQVHHLNHDRADNRGSNLIELSHEEHIQIHRDEARHWVAQAEALYKQGASCSAVGKQVGRAPSTVWRALAGRGVRMRRRVGGRRR